MGVSLSKHPHLFFWLKPCVSDSTELITRLASLYGRLKVCYICITLFPSTTLTTSGQSLISIGGYISTGYPVRSYPLSFETLPSAGVWDSFGVSILPFVWESFLLPADQHIRRLSAVHWDRLRILTLISDNIRRCRTCPTSHRQRVPRLQLFLLQRQ